MACAKCAQSQVQYSTKNKQYALEKRAVYNFSNTPAGVPQRSEARAYIPHVYAFSKAAEETGYKQSVSSLSSSPLWTRQASHSQPECIARLVITDGLKNTTRGESHTPIHDLY